MTNNLSKANEGRKNKSLDKQWRFTDYGITSFRDLIDRGDVFDKGKIEEVPKYKYNRRKYNRMGWDEQREYDEKLKQKKTAYFLYYKGEEGVSTEVGKFVYEYFMEKTNTGE